MSKYSKKFNSELPEATPSTSAAAAAASAPSPPSSPALTTSTAKEAILSSQTPDTERPTAHGSGRARLERRGRGGLHASASPTTTCASSSPSSSRATGEAASRDDSARSQPGEHGSATKDQTHAGHGGLAGEDSDAHADGDDGDDDDDGEADIDAAVAAGPSATNHGGGGASAGHLYACDVCPHLVFYSADAVQRHALEHHADLLPDFTKLQAVSTKLVPLWEQVKQRKAGVIAMWGRKIFHIARQRDAGPGKMDEALRAREQLEHVVRRWHANARVFIFGSSVTFGVWDGISDIDFTVVDVAEMEAGTWPPQERNAVRSITELLRRAGFSYVNLEPIPHARVPILKHHASTPIRVTDHPLDRKRALAAAELTPAEADEASRLEAEDVVARSVRYVLTSPASRQDRVVLEGSVRDAVGTEAVQQVWWNRTGEMMCLTCDTTLHAVQAAICGLSFVTPGMRAKVQPLHDECRPELYNVDFDLSFRAFGIRNSELLNRYLTSHPCARPGAIVLKDWSKTSGINNSMNGYLTSYAVNIMWIYFLVQKGVIPYIDPIADVPASLVGRTNFGPTYVPMLPESWSEEELEKLYAEAGELLLGFFFFYAHEFDWANHVVSLNRHTVTTKKMIGWDHEDVRYVSGGAAAGGLNHSGSAGASSSSSSSSSLPPPRKNGSARYTFCIEDPYEENLNLGRHMGITKALRVQTEFHRGLLSLLKDGEYDSCVFASTDRTEAVAARQSDEAGEGEKADDAAVGAASPGLLSASASQPPGRLPLKVLYKLMGVSLKEMARAKQAHLTATAGGTDTPFPGIREEQLRHALRDHAPQAYQLACKAWNYQQLLHRLGYKVHQGWVVSRREIGVRRLASQPQPPRGVVASAEARPSDSNNNNNDDVVAVVGNSGSGGDQPVAQAAGQRPQQEPMMMTMGLSERMATALAEGFLCLTPEWVAWSRPWAALHLRGFTFFTPREPPASPLSGGGAVDRGSGSGDGVGTGSGALRGTPPRRMRWAPPPAVGVAVRMARPAVPVASPTRWLKALLHK